MVSSGLSLDQAPPISVPLRFFITAPLFGILIGIVFLLFPSEILGNRYSDVAIGVVHLFTLGILSMIIFGAMQQMMPVLSGAVIKKPVLFANVVHIGLVLGTLLFSSSFIFDIPYLLHGAVLLLGISFLTFFIVVILLLMKVKFLTATVKAMKLFSYAGLITVILGLIIANNHIQDSIGLYHYAFVNSHLLFGIFGFAVLLIMGVSFQVIPMFYVAKDFPKVVQNKWPLFVFAMLFILSTFFFLDSNLFILKLIFILF